MTRTALAPLRHPLIAFGSALLGFCSLLWGASWLFPGTVAAGGVLISVTILGAWAVKPGWNLLPRGLTRQDARLFVLLLVSAAAAAWFLMLLDIPLPYDLSKPDLTAVIPGILAVTALEELMFRQVMFRWLEQRMHSPKAAVLATAAGFGLAHLGAAFRPGPVGPTFYVLQSLFMLWVGFLLGELRRVSAAWTASWAGHAAYNWTVLAVLAILKRG